jgi:hypothetical protein
MRTLRRGIGDVPVISEPVPTWVICRRSPLPMMMHASVEDGRADRRLPGEEVIWDAAPESRYHSGALPEDEGLAVALWRVACSEAMSQAWWGVVDELAPGLLYPGGSAP